VSRILAIIGLRIRLTLRRTRGAAGLADRIMGAVIALLGAAVSLGLAAGFGFLVHLTLETGDFAGIRNTYAIALYTFAFFALVLPYIGGSLDQGLDVSPLRMFPIRRARLYVIQMAAGLGGAEHLLYYPALAAVFVVGVVPGGAIAAGAAILLLVVLTFVVWSNAAVLLLVTVMRGRRLREILILVAFVALVAVSMGPSLFSSQGGEIDRESILRITAALGPVLRVARLLPPSLAAEGLARLNLGETAGALPTLLWLLLWNGAGIGLGLYIFDRHFLGDRSAARPRRRRSDAGAADDRAGLLSFDSRALRFLPDGIRAVAAKDFRYLLRSVAGKFNLLMLPLIVILAAVVVSDSVQQPRLGIDPERILLFGLLIYCTLFSNNFLNNAYAWEGVGVQNYFMLPASPRQVIAGKNLAVWLYNAILFVICMVVWGLLVRVPDIGTLVEAGLVYGISVLAFTTIGNVVSIYFPVWRNIASVTNTPSQIAIVFSLVAVAAIAALVALFLLLPSLLGLNYLLPLSLALLLALQIGLYWLVLQFAAGLLHERRQKLTETLRAGR